MMLSGDSPLGKPTVYADQYDAGLLFPIARAPSRTEIGLSGAPPFFGADLWTAYELSWLNTRGKPQIALAQFTVPCESLNIIESKSLKLYINSFSGTRFADADALRQRLRQDLSEAAWRGAEASASVGVRLIAPADFERERTQELQGLSLDRLDLECTEFAPAPQLLRVHRSRPRRALPDRLPHAGSLPAIRSSASTSSSKLTPLPERALKQPPHSSATT